MAMWRSSSPASGCTPAPTHPREHRPQVSGLAVPVSRGDGLSDVRAVARAVVAITQRMSGTGQITHVSDTARWTALHRATESARPDALFSDPLAEHLAGEGGCAIVTRVPWMTRNGGARGAYQDHRRRHCRSDRRWLRPGVEPKFCRRGEMLGTQMRKRCGLHRDELSGFDRLRLVRPRAPALSTARPA